MPAEFVSPGYSAFASNRGGGGGGGGVVQLQDSTGDNQAHLQEIGLQGLIQGEQSNMRFVQQGQLQAQQASLNAWQYQQQVTTNEQMQMRQDQNAIAAVDADQTMTDLEKMQAKTRIKSRIDWVGERQKRDYMAAQVEQAQAHAKMYTMQANLEDQRMQDAAAVAQNKVKTITDPSRATELADYVTSMQMDPKSPEGIKMMDKIAHEKGWTQTFAVNEKGAIVGKPLFVGANTVAPGVGMGGQAPGSGAGSSTGGGKGVAMDESFGQASTAHKDAFEMALKAIPSGTFEQHSEWANKYLANHSENMAKYTANTPQGKLEAEKKVHEQNQFQVQQAIEQLRSDNEITPNAKAERMAVLNRINYLQMKYPPSNPPPSPVRELMKQLKEREQFLDRVRRPKQQTAGVQAAPRPGDNSQWYQRSLADRVSGGVNDTLSAAEDFKSGVEGSFANSWEHYKRGYGRVYQFFSGDQSGK